MQAWRCRSPWPARPGRWASTGTSAPNSGVRTVVPSSPAKRPSSGWTTRATQAASSSGRGRLDLDTLAEPHPVGHALDLAVLQLGLGDGGVELQGEGVGLVGQALGQQAQGSNWEARRACSPTVA